MNLSTKYVPNDSLLSEIFQELETPSRKRVSIFTCSASDHKKLEESLKMSVPIANLKSAIEDAADTAISWAYNAIARLRVSPRTAATINTFKNCFVKPPDWQPPWKTNAMKWIDFGDLIATRLEDAAKILNGGWIKYNCIENAAHCPECASLSTYWACSSFKGKYVICLGKDFWEAWKSRDFDSLAITLLHEALHIYFRKTVAHSGRSGNAYCYERFVLTVNNRTIPKIVTDSCP